MPGVYDFEIRASSGELLGLIKRGGHGPAYGNPHPAEPVTFRAVIREDGSDHPPAVKFPPGFIPPDPARATAAERARWGGTGTGTADGVHVTTRRAESGRNAFRHVCPIEVSRDRDAVLGRQLQGARRDLVALGDVAPGMQDVQVPTVMRAASRYRDHVVDVCPAQITGERLAAPRADPALGGG